MFEWAHLDLQVSGFCVLTMIFTLSLLKLGS